MYFSERIRDPTRLRQIINEEREKFDLDNVAIKELLMEKEQIRSFTFDDGSPIPWDALAFSYKTDKNSYLLCVIEGRGNTRDGVRHELYHIAARQNETKQRSWLSKQLEEAGAVIYGSTGIKFR